MANYSWVFKLLNYVPTALEVVKMARGGDDEARLAKAEAALADVRKDTDKRIDALREELKEFRATHRQLRATLHLLQIIVWTTLAVSGVAIILSLIALIVAR